MAGEQVLIVDDDTDLAAVLSELLESRGYFPRQALTVGEALRSLDERLPDLVLLDWLLPGGPPADVAARCRASGVPIVLSSACADARRVARELGAVEILPKPFDVDTFFRIVDRSMRQGRFYESHDWK